MVKKTKKPAGETVRVGSGELKKMIDGAVKRAMKAQKNEEEEAFKADGMLGQTGGGIEELIADALELVEEKRKSLKEDGEELGEITAADILEAVEELSGGEKDDDSEEEEKGDESEEEEKEDDPEEEGKEGEEPEGQKSKKGLGSRKSTLRPVQRKYSSIFLPNGGQMQTMKKKQVPPEIQLARAVKCYDVHGKHDPEAAAFYAKKLYSDTEMAREFKALNATNPSAGGYLIPEMYLNQIIEMLYSKTVVFELGAQKVPMSNGNLNIPKMTAGARATWGGEQRKISKTQTAFGNIKLSAKRLQAIVPQTRELLLSTSYSADQLFANDLTRRMELGIDYGALYGSGGEFEPTGLRHNTGIEHIDAKKIGNLDIADADGRITADFPVYITARVLEKNVDDQRLGWAFNSATEGYFKNMKTTTGAYIYRDEMNGGKLLGFDYKVSNQIATSKEGYTELFFGNWSDLLCGEQLGLETYTTLDGSWTDEEGAQHNAFDENLAATRALMYIDLAARHDESFLSVHNIKVR